MVPDHDVGPCRDAEAELELGRGWDIGSQSCILKGATREQYIRELN